MDPISEQMSQLMDLDDAQLAELENAILTEFETNESQELSSVVIERMEQLAGAIESVRNEQSRRVTEREELSARAAEVTARVRPATDDVTTTVEGDTAPEGEATEGEAEGAPDGEAVPDEDEEPILDAEVEPTDEEPNAEIKDGELAFKTDPNKKLPTTEQGPKPGHAPSTDPSATPPGVATKDDQPDVQDQPPAQPEDTPAPIVEDPNIVKGKVDTRKKVPTSLSNEDTSDEDKTDSDEDRSPENTEEDPEAVVTAAAQGAGGSLVIEPPANHLPKVSAQQLTTSIVAGADIPGIGAGSRLDGMDNVATAFVKRLQTLRHVTSGDGEQHIVASLNYAYPEERQLSAGDVNENQRRIEAVASQESIVAAAGICLPLETNYDMHCDVGVTDRPVRDSLARFAADRGGIRYFTSPKLTDFTNATGYWKKDANGSAWHTYGPDGTTATNPPDLKPCLEVQCPEEKTAYISAVTLCLTFNNLTGRVFPELVERQNELALVQHARIAENNLLGQIEAGSTKIAVQSTTVGASREMFNLLARAVASYRFKHRMATSAPLRMLLGAWVRELLRADIALQMPGDGLDETLGLADAKIDAWFRSRGVNITWTLDGVGPSVKTATVATVQTNVDFAFPTIVEFGLFAEGTWLYLDGGTLDMGIIRDSSLVATNQYKQFVETFEGVVNIGCDSYWVEAPFVATGEAAALVDTRP